MKAKPPFGPSAALGDLSAQGPKKAGKKKLESGVGGYNYPNGATAEDRRRVRRTQRYAKKHGRM